MSSGVGGGMGLTAGAQLIAGGYEPMLSTVNLAPGETVSGLVAFDITASVGSLSLTTYVGTWAQWPITATAVTVLSGVFGCRFIRRRHELRSW